MKPPPRSDLSFPFSSPCLLSSPLPPLADRASLPSSFRVSPLFVSIGSRTPSPPLPHALCSSRAYCAQNRATCFTCGVGIDMPGFETPAEQRIHFRSDWHRCNLKRKVKGQRPLSEGEFENMLDEAGDDVESISGPLLLLRARGAASEGTADDGREQRQGNPGIWARMGRALTVLSRLFVFSASRFPRP